MILTFNGLSIGGGNRIRIKPPIKGLGLPKPKNSLTPIPNFNKSQFNSNRYKDRVLQIECLIVGGGVTPYMDYLEQRDELQKALYKTNEQTEFILSTEGFSEVGREYKFYGTIEDFDPPLDRVPYSEFTLSIRCADPMFYETVVMSGTQSFTLPGRTLPFTLPAILGADSSTLLIVTNNSNALDLYATASINGPCRNITIENLTTGKVSKIGDSTNNYYLATGNTLVIDGQNKTIKENGQNRFSFLNSFEALKLALGPNSFRFTTDGNNQITTQATVSFTAQYSHI